MDRAARAKENFLKGYNCTQAVLLAFSDVIGLSEREALKVSAPFGGGVGRMREICGTVSGMMLALGLIFYDSDHVTAEEKKALYVREQELASRFHSLPPILHRSVQSPMQSCSKGSWGLSV